MELVETRLSYFEVVLNTFTVFDIAVPLTVFVRPDESLEDVSERFLEAQIEQGPDAWFCLILDDEQVVGYLALDSEVFFPDRESGGFTARQAAEPIGIDQVVPGSMKLLDLVPLFEQHYFFFVLSRNSLTHVVTFQDLDKLPMKLAMFSLFLQLEGLMIDHLSNVSRGIERLFKSLNLRRQDKARELCRLKYREETAKKLLLCTTFVDKKEMMKVDGLLYDLLRFPSKRKVDRFFHSVEEVRNLIAHSDSILSILESPSSMHQFLTDLQEGIRRLSRPTSPLV